MNQGHGDRMSAGPPAWCRNLASLLILVHLTCLGLLLSATFAPSALQLRLTELFGPYAGLLAMEPTGKELFITHGNQDDVDHRLEWTPSAGEGSSAWRQALPRCRNRVGFERRREQRLVWEAARRFLNVDDTPVVSEGSLLLTAVGRWLLEHESEAPRAVRVRRHMLQSPDAVASTDARARDPSSDRYFELAVRAHLVVEEQKGTKVVRIVRRTLPSEEARRRDRPTPRRRQP